VNTTPEYRGFCWLPEKHPRKVCAEKQNGAQTLRTVSLIECWSVVLENQQRLRI
jgi:hypothetical protein